MLAVLRRGRLRSLGTDQFTLDVTKGPLDEARRRISRSASPGHAFLSFPQLVMPKGPITRLRIAVDVRGDAAQLPVIQWSVEYQAKDAARARRTQDGGGEIRFEEPMLPGPIGVTVMVRGEPARARFTVATPGGQQTAEWTVGGDCA